jgi:hypothetical protein
MSFAVTPGPKLAVDPDQHRLGLLDQQALRGQHVLDFGRADAERQRAERTVRARMRVAADDRHAGQRRPALRADHVDDALALVAERKIRLRAGRLDVGVERLDLRARNGVADALVPVRRRRVVIGGGDDRLRAPRHADPPA